MVILIVMFVLKGDFVWLDPKEKSEYDVAIGGRVYNSTSSQIQIVDDEGKVYKHILFFPQFESESNIKNPIIISIKSV